MIDTFKKELNNLCEKLGTNNETVLKVSQELDELIVKEQRRRLKNLKKQVS